MPTNRHKNTIFIATIVALALGVVVAWPRINFYMLTGRFSPIEQIESLQNPVGVTGWGADGLRLADGRTLQLPGLRSLPKESAALSEATKRGVEICPDGRVWALVRVHHGCGNDPVREHIARVDLSDMMMFLRVGEPVSTVPEAEHLARVPRGTFTEWGWRIGEYMEFQSWERMKESAQ